MGSYDFIKVESQEPFFYIILNRPQKKNAFNLQMICEFTEAVKDLSLREKCQVLIIKGEGDTFSAGADLRWMKDQLHQSFEDNLKESEILFEMFLSLKNCKKPVISYVHNHVMGGAIGIVAASDYCFAVEGTKFCFSETRMGLAPAVISPFILDKCSYSLAQRYMNFAEFFDVCKAYEMGLIQVIGSKNEIHTLFNTFLDHLMQLDLKAVYETKSLIQNIRNKNFESYRDETTRLISHLRVQNSAQQRLKSFLERKTKL